MRLRALAFASAITLAVLAAYYAGYRHGIATPPPGQLTAAAAAGESERVREPAQLDGDQETLMARDLTSPIDGVKASAILDTFNEARTGGKRHEATDIMTPRGTPIHAVEDGTIRKLFLSRAGGNTIYEFDPPVVYCFYYAHLDHYAEGLHEGMGVKKGDVIGYAGSTGDASANAPHLHFAIFKLGPEKNWWQGAAINPYPILLRLADR